MPSDRYFRALNRRRYMEGINPDGIKDSHAHHAAAEDERVFEEYHCGLGCEAQSKPGKRGDL